ncbi:MAG: hypothetical protein ABJC04_11865, partial [Verrucomicrobiota bacterium]
MKPVIGGEGHSFAACYNVGHRSHRMRSKDFEMINSAFCALADREEKQGSQSISDIERVVLLVWHASGIIGNGGFRYFFECGLSLSATSA